MVAVPAVFPVTMPEVPIDAISGLLLVHVPPLVVLLSVVVLPVQTVAVPVMALTTVPGVTVTFLVVRAVPQSVVTIYDIVLVPADMPVTIPVMPTVPTAVLLLLQEPPGDALLSAVVLPAQTEATPVIGLAVGSVLTVTTFVATAEPQVPGRT
jgi:hypothetical protein